MAEFGYHTIGGTSGAEGPSTLDGTRFTLSEAGDVTSVSVYCANLSASVTPAFRTAIYDVSAGEPNALKGTGAEVELAVSAPAAWRESALTVSLAAGDYYLCVWTDTDGAQFEAYWDGGATERYRTATYHSTNPAPDPFGSASTGSAKLSIFATYTPSAPPGPPGDRIIQVRAAFW